MVGKRAGWTLVVASTSGLKDGLWYTWDKMSGSRFLVDMEAEVNVFPATGLETQTKQPGPSLVAANDSTIKTYRVCTIPTPTKKYKWDLIIAEVSRPLLGGDLLRANLLLVDLKGKRLADTETYFFIPLCKTGSLSPTSAPFHPIIIAFVGFCPYWLILSSL